MLEPRASKERLEFVETMAKRVTLELQVCKVLVAVPVQLDQKENADRVVKPALLDWMDCPAPSANSVKLVHPVLLVSTVFEAFKVLPDQVASMAA